MVRFSIDFGKSISKEKRLKQNGEFGEIDNSNESYQDDKLFENWEEAKAWLNTNPSVMIEGTEYETQPGSHLFGSPSFSIRPHRINKPAKTYPLKEEVYDLLRNANDNVYNMLVIDFEGYPKLIQKPAFSYAVRLEGFGAGNGYVGLDSQMNHFDSTYLILLEGWLSHLESSGISIYQDYSTGQKTEQELIKEILKAIEKFK